MPRYQLQFAWLERYINKRYPGQEAASSSPLSFPLFVLLSHHRFFPVPPSVYRVRAYIRVLTVFFSGTQNITIPLASSILSDVSLIFWKGKRARELGTPCRQASSLRVTSLISIYRLFVSFTFLSLFLSLSFVALLSFIPYILLLGARR